MTCPNCHGQGWSKPHPCAIADDCPNEGDCQNCEHHDESEPCDECGGDGYLEGMAAEWVRKEMAYDERG